MIKELCGFKDGSLSHASLVTSDKTFLKKLSAVRAKAPTRKRKRRRKSKAKRFTLHANVIRCKLKFQFGSVIQFKLVEVC